MTEHWTKRSVADFVYRISFDFAAQLRARLEQKKITRAQFAKRASVTESRVSQVFNNPGNLGLESMTRYARALGMKVAIVAYDDGDPANHKGPINSEIFNACWKRVGAPEDFFALDTARIYQFVQLPNVSATVHFTPKSELGYSYPDRSVVNSVTHLVHSNA
jgi:transcriptional regulator with XRE-family HTH domain